MRASPLDQDRSDEHVVLLLVGMWLVGLLYCTSRDTLQYFSHRPPPLSPVADHIPQRYAFGFSPHFGRLVRTPGQTPERRGPAEKLVLTAYWQWYSIQLYKPQRVVRLLAWT